jgi:hypothetical protein
MSASWFTEPFEAANELQLHRPVITIILLLLAALFNLSLLLLHSFFLPDPPPQLTGTVLGISLPASWVLVLPPQLAMLAQVDPLMCVRTCSWLNVEYCSR